MKLHLGFRLQALVYLAGLYLVIGALHAMAWVMRKLDP
jgi:hypothetical protein